MKRVKLKSAKPNPLFELWLEEWMQEATSRNPDLRKHFLKALGSLKKYPLPLRSGKDCIILQHFGAKLCSMLDRKLQEYRVTNKTSSINDEFFCTSCAYEEQCNLARKKSNKKQAATDISRKQQEADLLSFDGIKVAAWSLEMYAILLTLYNCTQSINNTGYIFETDLLHETSKLQSTVSKTSILPLLNEGLVCMTGSPIRYNLTEHGIAIARKICEITSIDATLVKSSEILSEVRMRLHESYTKSSVLSTNLKNANDRNSNVALLISEGNNSNNSLPSNAKGKSSNGINKQTEQAVIGKVKSTKSNAINKKANSKKDTVDDIQKDVYIEANKFDITLLVDTQETCGGKTKPQDDATIAELSKLGVLFEVRHLKVGDFAWVARCKLTSNELILPYIVERKRIDDLSASITDGRFHEQKFRLKQSGIDNLIYIVENYDKNLRLAIPHSSLMQASINSLVQDGFTLKYTRSHKDSMFYLSTLTRVLNQVYQGKNLVGCKKENLVRSNILAGSIHLMQFDEFNKAASKQKVFNVTQMFVRQLLQLKGMSVDKALAIVECYPTPRILIDAFRKSGTNGETLLSGIKFGPQKRLLGPAISKIVYQLYTRKDLG